jgi:hypothetical protein
VTYDPNASCYSKDVVEAREIIEWRFGCGTKELLGKHEAKYLDKDGKVANNAADLGVETPIFT